MTKYYVDPNGTYLGGFDGGVDEGGVEIEHPDVPAGAVEIMAPPEDARQVWDGTTWSPKPAPDVAPLTAEELYDMLAAKGVVVEADRPRLKPVDKTGIVS